MKLWKYSQVIVAIQCLGMGLQNLSSESKCKDVNSLGCEKLILRWNRVFLSPLSKLLISMNSWIIVTVMN